MQHGGRLDDLRVNFPPLTARINRGVLWQYILALPPMGVVGWRNDRKLCMPPGAPPFLGRELHFAEHKSKREGGSLRASAGETICGC